MRDAAGATSGKSDRITEEVRKRRVGEKRWSPAWTALNAGTMNNGNALRFFGLGLVMVLIPAVAPHWFQGNGFDGSSGRAIWLGVVGGVQIALGGGYLTGRWIVATMARMAVLAAQTRAALAEADAAAAESQRGVVAS